MSIYINGERVHYGSYGELPFNYEADLSNSKYDQNTWYPVELKNLKLSNYAQVDFRTLRPEHINVYLPLDTFNASWGALRNSAYASFNAQIYVSNWGVRDARENMGIIFEHTFNKVSDNKDPIFIQIPNNTNQAMIYLRGGGIYQIECDMEHEIIIHDRQYTHNNETIGPTKEVKNDSRLIDLMGLQSQIDALKSKLGGKITS